MGYTDRLNAAPKHRRRWNRNSVVLHYVLVDRGNDNNNTL